MNRLGDYAIGYQGSDDPFENYIDEYPIATKREIWEQAHREATEEVAKAHRRGWEQAKEKCVKISMGMFDCNGEEVANVIDALEYKELTND